MKSHHRVKKSKSQLQEDALGAERSADLSVATKVAFRLLAIRGRSVAELRERLREKGFPATLVEHVLADLRYQGLLDDALFATLRAESILRKKPVGRYVLSGALLRHKLPSAVITAVVEKLLPYERECALARQALESAWAQLAPSRRGKPFKACILLMRTLRQRGFSREVIAQMVESDIPKLLGSAGDSFEPESP